MESYEIRFKKKQSYITLGVVWILLCLFWTILLITFVLVFKIILSIGAVCMIILITINITLAFILGKYYITLSSQTYIKIYNKELEVHKGLAQKKQFVKFEDIEEVRLIGQKIVLLLMDYCSNKEIEIFSDLMYLKDLDILINNLSKNNKSIKRL